MEWINPADPTKGFRYMYLSDADYAAVSARAETAVLKAIPLVTEAGALHGPRSCAGTQVLHAKHDLRGVSAICREHAYEVSVSLATTSLRRGSTVAACHG